MTVAEKGLRAVASSATATSRMIALLMQLHLVVVALTVAEALEAVPAAADAGAAKRAGVDELMRDCTSAVASEVFHVMMHALVEAYGMTTPGPALEAAMLVWREALERKLSLGLPIEPLRVQVAVTANLQQVSFGQQLLQRAPGGGGGRGDAAGRGRGRPSAPAPPAGGFVCRDFLAGRCYRANCRFPHSAEPAAAHAAAPAPPSLAASAVVPYMGQVGRGRGMP